MERGVDYFHFGRFKHAFHGGIIAITAIIVDDVGGVFAAAATGKATTPQIRAQLTDPSFRVRH